MSEGESGRDDREAQARLIARRYLELWQDQVSALFSDPQGLAQAGRLMAASLTPAPEQVWTLWRDLANLQAGSRGMEQGRHDQKRAGNGVDESPAGAQTGAETGAETGAASAAAASAGRDERLDELLARFEALEERIAALESAARATGSRPRAGKRIATRRRPAKGA